jgi:hypothetical protein
VKRPFALAPLVGSLLFAQTPAAAPKVIDHVCAANEGKETCPLGRVRMCTKEGALAACACAPGATEKAGQCVLDATPVTVACIVPDATIGKQIAPFAEFGSLEMPPLPTSHAAQALEIAGAVSGREDKATADELLDAAKAWDAIEGAAAYEAQSKIKPKLATRDHANARGIVARDRFVARFFAHSRADEMRIGLARGLLRRAAYAGVGPSVDADRKAAWEQLEFVIKNGAGRALRDASFMLGERDVRDKSWGAVLVHEERALKVAAQKQFADDHAFLAASTLRVAQARFETADLVRGRGSLEEAIALGMVCAPRTECVVAASAARRALAAAWAATSAPARTMIATLQKGTLPRPDRVRPLLQLADLYAKGVGAACPSAAEEARAWEQTFAP